MLPKLALPSLLLSGLGGLAFIIFSVIKEDLSVRDGGTDRWSPMFLVTTLILFIAQFYFNALTRAVERYSFWSFGLSVVLFVQVTTILSALAVIQVVTTEKIESWVLPTMVIAVPLLLMIVLVQGFTLMWTRERVQRQFENLLRDKNPPLEVRKFYALTAVGRYMLPVDFDPWKRFSVAAKYPETWEDVKSLLASHAVDLSEQELKKMRGEKEGAFAGAGDIYLLAGILGGFIGSAAVVLGGGAVLG